MKENTRGKKMLTQSDCLFLLPDRPMPDGLTLDSKLPPSPLHPRTLGRRRLLVSSRKKSRGDETDVSRLESVEFWQLDSAQVVWW